MTRETAKKKEKPEEKTAIVVEEAVEVKEKLEGIEEVPDQQSLWKPVTELGRKVQKGEVGNVDDFFDAGYRIMEAGITDTLLPSLDEELLLVGQAHGKFGGGQRRIFKQTQKKTAEGNKPNFMTCAVIGNKDGFVGLGVGNSKETVPSRDKAKRNAKLNMIRIRRGCGSWECNCRQPHSIPFAVTGKSGSVEITLIPAPKGKGLCAEKECAKILTLAGIKDIWTKTDGQTGTKLNLAQATLKALKKLSDVKVSPENIQKLGIIEGKLKETKVEQE
ncbi:MAG: 30S ribosomal protein S5 [Candidatus Woesearchaeota archaeon]|jgi:small subunit ribosomal protein S5